MAFVLIQIAFSASFGLLVGSWLLEALVLVPFWRTMKAEDFLALYADLGVWIYRYFAPLTIITTVLGLSATVAPFVRGDAPGMYQLISMAMILITLGMFAVYFKKSIANFKAGIVGDGGVAEDLRRWARWHSVRVAVGMIGFVSSLIALRVG